MKQRWKMLKYLETKYFQIDIQNNPETIINLLEHYSFYLSLGMFATSSIKFNTKDGEIFCKSLI